MYNTPVEEWWNKHGAEDMSFDEIKLKRRFLQLAHQWRIETCFMSSPSERGKNQNYQQIIDMGEQVIPFLLERLEQGMIEDWFFALATITGENPVPHEDLGKFPEMTEHWMNWGREQGYL